MAAATGVLGSTITSWVLLKKPDLGMTINGCLAGLVAITAPCAFVSVGSSALIGLIAGFIVVPAVIFFDKIHVDDPVGATAVHLVNGVFGTLCVGLFAQDWVSPNGSVYWRRCGWSVCVYCLAHFLGSSEGHHWNSRELAGRNSRFGYWRTWQFRLSRLCHA